MFSMGHINPSTYSIDGTINDNRNLLVPGKVIASTIIEKGTISKPIDHQSLLGNTDVIQILALTNPDGYIELNEISRKLWCKDIHWIRAVRLSNDCHSYNIQLRFQQICDKNNQSEGKLVLQAIKTIDIGEELILWFAEDILPLLQIGFLSPAHIQGQKKYVCIKCSTLFESPNPLKIHNALSCGKFSIKFLWEQLSKALDENNYQQNHYNLDIRNNLIDGNQLYSHQQINAIDLTIIRPDNLKTTFQPYLENSAFKPYKKLEQNNQQQHEQQQQQQQQINLTLWPHLQIKKPEKEFYGDEAQIETLVSSLGKSKQGHICLYCGKCYSRKYGLKIHIRTHTGYKPLKCKYCQRPFGDPSNLNKHVRLHAEGNTPYKCDLCGKILVRRRDLDRHIKSRHTDFDHLKDEDTSSQISPSPT